MAFLDDDGKILVGKNVSDAFDWLIDVAGGFFDAIESILSATIDVVLAVLQFPPAYLMVLIFAALTWVIQRDWKRVVVVALCFLFVINQGYWDETMETLTLVLSSCVLCMGVGVPIGIAAAHRPRLYAAL